jgi:hypothetical protein
MMHSMIYLLFGILAAVLTQAVPFPSGPRSPRSKPIEPPRDFVEIKDLNGNIIGKPIKVSRHNIVNTFRTVKYMRKHKDRIPEMDLKTSKYSKLGI